MKRPSSVPQCKGANKCKFIKTDVLKMFWQNNTEKLLTRIFSYMKIARF